MLKLIFVCSAYAFFVTQALSKTLCLSPVWLCDSLKMAYAQSRKEQQQKKTEEMLKAIIERTM